MNISKDDKVFQRWDSAQQEGVVLDITSGLDGLTAKVCWDDPKFNGPDGYTLERTANLVKAPDPVVKYNDCLEGMKRAH